MKYDDASWHSGGEYPEDLPAEAAATHIAMFLAWALLHDLGGEFHVVDAPDALDRLRARRITPGRYFLEECDEKLTDEDFDETGNEFAKAYYDAEGSPYIADYEALLGKGLDSLYHVEDSWLNYDILSPRIEKRFADWQHPPSMLSRLFSVFARRSPN